MIGDGESTATAFRPAYIHDLGIGTSAIDFAEEGFFMIATDCEDMDKISQLESNADVVDISSDKKDLATRNKVKSRLKVNIKAGEDIVEKLGRLKHDDFDKASFKVFSQ